MSEIGHGGKEIVERILDPRTAGEKIKGLKKVPVREQMAVEVIDIAYGFFSPLQGFLGKKDVESVCKKMRLADGTVWSIPIVFDISDKEIADYGVKEGEAVLLTYKESPIAVFDVEEIYAYNKQEMAKDVYGTNDEKHPGVKLTSQMKDKFLGGKITMVSKPIINEPFTEFLLTPLEMRKKIKEKGWVRSCCPPDQKRTPHRT